MLEIAEIEIKPFQEEELISLHGREKFVNHGGVKSGNLRQPILSRLDILLSEPLHKCG